jgi:hypothetical protein
MVQVQAIQLLYGFVSETMCPTIPMLIYLMQVAQCVELLLLSRDTQREETLIKEQT